MSRRFWAAYGSQPDMFGTALGPDRLDLCLPGEGQPQMGWGIGFYQNGEPLVRKAPREEHPEKDLLEVVKQIRADLLVGHVREATFGTLRADNTHPFRFRNWLFAHSGSIATFEEVRERMVEAMPDFLARSVKGETDSECFFHLVLSFLYDWRTLDDPGIEPSRVGEAMAKTVLMVDKLEADAGATGESPYLLLMSNGYLLVALRRSPMRLGYMTYEAPGRAEVRPRAVLVGCERTQRGTSWQPLENRSVLRVRRDLSVDVTEF